MTATEIKQKHHLIAIPPSKPTDFSKFWKLVKGLFER